MNEQGQTRERFSVLRIKKFRRHVTSSTMTSMYCSNWRHRQQVTSIRCQLTNTRFSRIMKEVFRDAKRFYRVRRRGEGIKSLHFPLTLFIKSKTLVHFALVMYNGACVFVLLQTIHDSKTCHFFSPFQTTNLFLLFGLWWWRRCCFYEPCNGEYIFVDGELLRKEEWTDGLRGIVVESIDIFSLRTSCQSDFVS